MKSLLVFSAFSLFSVTQAWAQLDPRFVEVITVSDRDNLDYWYSHSEPCPWSEDEAVSLIEGVIKRSRIKPSRSINLLNEVYLDVGVVCVDITVGGGGIVAGRSIYARVMFGDYPMLYDRDYGSLWVMPSDDSDVALMKIRGAVEQAITDFVEVNFLMGR